MHLVVEIMSAWCGEKKSRIFEIGKIVMETTGQIQYIFLVEIQEIFGTAHQHLVFYLVYITFHINLYLNSNETVKFTKIYIMFL